MASSNKSHYRPQDAHYNVVSPVLRRQQWSKVAPEVEAVDGPSRVPGLFRLKIEEIYGCRTNLLRLKSGMYPNYYLYHCTKTLHFPATFIVSEDLLGASLFGQLDLGQTGGNRSRRFPWQPGTRHQSFEVLGKR